MIFFHGELDQYIMHFHGTEDEPDFERSRFVLVKSFQKTNPEKKPHLLLKGDSKNSHHLGMLNGTMPWLES